MRFISTIALAMAATAMASAPPNPEERSKSIRTGTACFTTTTTMGQSCGPGTNAQGKPAQVCTQVPQASAGCLPHWLCNQDSGEAVCMKKHDSLDLGGIIVAHKRAAAKAEAVALARAATKKKRAEEMRAPLMSQPEGASNPFQDQQQQPQHSEYQPQHDYSHPAGYQQPSHQDQTQQNPHPYGS
ncbi:hypothetical protein VHEMI02363 [[Torrubiella] hemipterigena]|uniref:Uncharacterized protein n=1 Tax=[Torrubiella] hemipterigena TaxID=1531966 RepID=A0A0A1T7M9_9HYPO|nr:hypothetical protein VHEMI02363 [[Torrubiella] hemipterigena]